MATKLTANVAKRVKALGINATTDEAARPELLKILEDNGIEQMDDEDITTLVEIAESFVEVDSDGDNEEDENDALAKEVEEEEEEETEEEEEETEEEEEETEEGDELDDMDRSALKAYIKENGLDISVKKSWSDDDIREKIREAISSEEEEEEEEEEAPKPTPAPKKEEKKPAKKEEKATEKKATTKRGNKLDPKNNEEDREHFDFLKEIFPEDKYIYAWVASAGITIKNKGKNSNRSLISLENCTIKGEGKDSVMTCNLYLLIFNNKYDILDKADIEYEKCWSGAPMLKGIEVSEALEIIEKLKEEMYKLVGGIDKKLGDNRKKMEGNLKKDKKAAGKVSSKKAAEEEEEEEEAPAPKKPAKAAAKKTVKKK